MKHVALLSLCVFFYGCESNEQEAAGRSGYSGRLPSVEIVQTKSGSMALEQRLTGSVKARNQVQIFAEVSGPIVEIYINDGDIVTAGDRLLRVRDTDYRERLNQAIAGEQIAAARVKQVEANLMRLETQLGRITTLSERNLTSALEIETAQVNVLSARADLDMAMAQQRQATAIVSEHKNAFDNTVIRAPISGVIGARNAEVGQQITNNTPLFIIGDPSEMRVRVTLTEAMLRRVNTDTLAIISSENSPDANIQAKVSRVLPFLNPVTHTTEAEIDIHEHNNFLRPGMYVAVDLIYGKSAEGSLVPNSALYLHPRMGTLGVYTVEESDEFIASEIVSGSDQTASVMFQPITLLAQGRLMSAVEGITHEAWVVTIGHYLLSSRARSDAQVTATDWDHILQLQQVQNRDLLDAIVNKDKSSDSL